MIRWALADGLTKDEGEAVERLRRSLRSGSFLLRCEEQVTQERHMTRVQKLSTSEKSPTDDGTGGEPVVVDCCVVLFREYGCRFFFVLIPVLINTLQAT